ncbi:TlpA family protein disulfide reductase [Limibacterium fermenti]|uniref:TlpA family protein disulfide reductase n=1 Tax=Limibacterium fermenti TaxID=3229863 RepID=UPI000E8F2EEB|nr:hypothetical protein [Porphyromonadaceae bacterium]
MSKYIILLFCSVVYINSYSQEHAKVTQNSDGSISVQSEGNEWFDPSGNIISEKQMKDSLKTGRYSITIDTNSSIAKIHLVNNYPAKTKIIGKKLPPLLYPDLSGRPVDIATNAKKSVLSFWSITCAPCIRELSVFNLLAKEYPNIDFYAITSDDKDSVVHFLEQNNEKWDNIVIIPDYNKEAYDPGIYVYPSTFLINKERIIQNVFWGASLRQIFTALDVLDKES